MKSKLIPLARNLRKEMTLPERKLWRYLRAKQINNLKFRRQQPIGKYIVDFVCFEKKLVIEIDGGQHFDNKEKDFRRTQWLNERCYKVVRFWNNEVLNHCSAVVDEIVNHCS